MAADQKDVHPTEARPVADGRTASEVAKTPEGFHRNVPEVARFTVVSQISYQCPNLQPLSVPVRFSKVITNPEQHYNRLLRVGSSWQVLETGWAGDSSYILVMNRSATAEVRLGVTTDKSGVAPSTFAVVCSGESVLVRKPTGAVYTLLSSENNTVVTVYAFSLDGKDD